MTKIIYTPLELNISFTEEDIKTCIYAIDQLEKKTRKDTMTKYKLEFVLENIRLDEEELDEE